MEDKGPDRPPALRRGRRHRARRVPVVLLAALVVPACAPPGNPMRFDAVTDSGYVETGDLPAIRERGTLRILVPPPREPNGAGGGDLAERELRMARRLASWLDLEPLVVSVGDRGVLLHFLLEGRGDVLVGRLTATLERRRRFAFSVPVDFVREILVCRADDPGFGEIGDLAGRRVAVRRSSSFFETLAELREEVPDVQIVLVDDAVDTAGLLLRVADGEFDATVADEDLFKEVQSYRSGLRAAFPLTEERPIAWALRPDCPELKAAVDSFLHEQALVADRHGNGFGDLDVIRERGVLRMLTRNNAATYFLYRGRQLGFELELVQRYADRIGCQVRVVVPPKADQLIPWLLEGRGDLIAAAMTVTEDREREVRFSRSYNRVSELVVTRGEDEGLQSLEQLAGRAIAVRPSSSYRATLEALSSTIPFRIVDAPEELETEELIARVAEGVYDLTVADSNLVDIELTYRDDIRPAFPLGNPKDHAWAVRPEDTDLLRDIDRFFAETYRGTFYNVIKDKYFKNKRRIARVVQSRPSRQGRLSLYDELFREYGRQNELDWRLLAAVAYQESRFNPEAVSWAGAVGLMQIMPRTAGELGIEGDLTDPEVGIRAGASYLRRLIDQFEPTLPYSERLRFALASYNAGSGHIADGRRLAAELGRDPDVWFENVEQVLPLLGKTKYAQQARYGYCRCIQPLYYVRQINDRYVAYTRVLN